MPRIDYESEGFPAGGPVPNGMSILDFTWDDSAMAGQSSAPFQHVGSAGASLLGQGSGALATSVTVIVDELYDAPGNPGQSFAVVDDGQPIAHIDLYIFTNTCQYAFAASWFVTVKTTYTIGATSTRSSSRRCRI